MALPAGKSALFAWAAALVLLVVICLALFGRRTNPKIETRTTSTQPATRPAPASKPAKVPEPKYVSTLMDVVHQEFPAFPVTQPLAMPLSLSEAARLIIRDPVYFDASGSLIWITRPDAPPTDTLLQKPFDDPERVVVTRERVLCVHWLFDGRTSWPFIVVPAASGSESPSGCELLSHLGRQPAGARRDYRWGRAMSWYEKLVVPTASGVSVFKFPLDADGRPVMGPNGPTPVEDYQDLANLVPASGPTTPTTSGPLADVQILLDWQGLLAFIPWDPGKRGGRGAARFINDKWNVLGPATGWPEYTLHLIPLLDGSVMQFVLTRPSDDDPDAPPAATGTDPSAVSLSNPHSWPVKLGVVDLDHAAVDARKIKTLVDRLGDDDQSVRDKAFEELTRYGPSIAPILKGLYDDAVPEAQVRLKQLLRNQTAPLLGGMSLLGSDIRLVCRNPDGSAVFYSEKGVQSAGPDGDAVVTAPAWLAVRPGHSVELLSGALTADLKPEKASIVSVADEWIVTSDVRGPRRFIGNGFINMLRKDEAGFTEVVGEDHRGRWLLRRPAGQTAVNSPTTFPADGSATQPVTTQAVARAPQSPSEIPETLIIDPTLPNLVPRLPVWNYTTADEVGWDRDDWPAVKQLGNVSRLTENGWEVAAADDALLSRPDQAPTIPGPPATRPAAILPIFQTTYTPAPATVPVALPATVATTLPTPPTTEAHSRPSTATGSGAPGRETASGDAAPATAQAPTEPAETPLWVDRDGTRYFNGIDALRVVTPSGASVSWTLPDVATGKEPVHLVKTADGRLYLFNQPGRVLRLKPTPDGPDPFVIEATFTRNIPNVDQPTRVWLDSAGRIIMAHDKSLAILFPAGYLPPRIRALMSDVDDEDDDMPKP